MIAPPPAVVTLYGRPGCSLCDQALHLLRPIARRMKLDVRLVNIETDDALHTRYMFEIPVVALGDREVAKWPFSGPTLQALLEEALE